MNEQIQNLIARHQEGGVTQEDCIKCSSGCCSQGGFAILENVEAIYELYMDGNLKRRGLKFKKGLSLRDFIFEYFDVWKRPVDEGEDSEELMFFHMKSIDDFGRPISIPGNSYWDIRSELFERNPWMNEGCVFLSHPVPNWPENDGKSKRHCILHGKTSKYGMDAKPYDCMFYTCTEPYKAKTPTEDESDNWFKALNEAYPGSVERFQRIYDGEES